MYKDNNPKSIFGDKKPPLDKIPPSALYHLSLPMGDGAEKYGPFNYRENPVSASTYIGAMMRHIISFTDREDIDPESKRGAHHLAAVMACCAIVLDARECGTLVDDRPSKSSNSAELIRQFTSRQNDMDYPGKIIEVEEEDLRDLPF